jgi:alginate O-acetyltransferase complex protein AlgI
VFYVILRRHIFVMSFQSVFFLPFILVVIIAYFATPATRRWIVLLIGSVFFYLSLGYLYLLIPLVLVVVISYIAGIRMVSQDPARPARKWFLFGIMADVLVLIFFRSYPIVASQWIQGTGPGQVIAVIGVSFYVFQAVSYLVDIYLCKINPEKHVGIFALYISFFPKILQGPIERGRDLLPQLHQNEDFSYENARLGALRFTYGLFKKLVVADRIGMIVDTIYGRMQDVSGLALLFATVLYSFQLYYDFSGYTDMAIGIARVFNIRLVENFNIPYLAKSVAEFWRKWHMSFSRWIMDYLFKPIQLSLRHWGVWGSAIALLITFALSGIWHGFSWGFLIWGGLHGFYLVVDLLYSPYRKKLYKTLKLDRSPVASVWQVLLTFGFVTFAWIFFRANSISDAVTIVRKIMIPIQLIPVPYRLCGRAVLGSIIGVGDSLLVLSAACQSPIQEFTFYPGVLQIANYWLTLAALPMAYFMSKEWPRLYSSRRPAWQRWAYYSLVVVVIFLSQLFLPLSSSTTTPYLYGAF